MCVHVCVCDNTKKLSKDFKIKDYFWREEEI